jgi:beta-aspartyl-peptidase (threonine type)
MWEMPQRGPNLSIATALRELRSVGGEAGGIALDLHGRFGCAHNSPNFAVAYTSQTITVRAILHQDEMSEVAALGGDTLA